MHFIEKEEIIKLEFELLKNFPKISHGVIGRKGGASPFPYHALNLNLDHQALSSDVADNLNKVIRILDLGLPIFAKQEHQNKIAFVTPENAHELFICDGFITCHPHLALMVKHADCQAGLFYDPMKNVIANVHCGWRGNVLNIYSKTIEKMREVYGCLPSNILACISPSLGPKHAEFVHYKKEFPTSFWSFRQDNDLFDLWSIAKTQLLKAGILENHIEIAKICTYENTDLFFSYRAEKETGRNISYIMLN